MCGKIPRDMQASAADIMKKAMVACSEELDTQFGGLCHKLSGGIGWCLS